MGEKIAQQLTLMVLGSLILSCVAIKAQRQELHEQDASGLLEPGMYSIKINCSGVVRTLVSDKQIHSSQNAWAGLVKDYKLEREKYGQKFKCWKGSSLKTYNTITVIDNDNKNANNCLVTQAIIYSGSWTRGVFAYQSTPVGIILDQSKRKHNYQMIISKNPNGYYQIRTQYFDNYGNTNNGILGGYKEYVITNDAKWSGAYFVSESASDRNDYCYDWIITKI